MGPKGPDKCPKKAAGALPPQRSGEDREGSGVTAAGKAGSSQKLEEAEMTVP